MHYCNRRMFGLRDSIESRYFCVKISMSEKAQKPWKENPILYLFLFCIWYTSYNQGRSFAGMEMGLHRRKLCRLSPCYILRGDITAQRLQQRRDTTEQRSSPECRHVKANILVL